MPPKISVIMSVFNGEIYLSDAINSILNQTYSNFEFLIVDDGSTDSSREILKKFKKNDPRIRLFLNKKNIGLPAALNLAISKSNGKFIARMDSDDISLPNRFETQIDFLEKNPDIFLIGSSAIIIDEDGKRIGALRKFNNPKKVQKKLITHNPLIHPSIMFRTSKLRYNPKFKYSQDYDFYLRALVSGKKITNLSDLLIKYRIFSKDMNIQKIRKQRIFFKKAKDSYFSGIKTEMISKNLEQSLNELDIKKDYEMSMILIYIQDNKMKEARKNILFYVKKYGINSRIILLFLISFIPYKITHFLKSKF